ncbi:nuclear exosome regulator NRDE2 isoform X1 [Sorex araneus]|uniref:nuclear exosome regulator NRDE2 isoform X1 n=1 Tax=Sorex araneus TaxID=42254 RepID=UPI0024339413|nr:nuclear exosome regulator NRDE2 isoform X1 [Sorex araneus]
MALFPAFAAVGEAPDGGNSRRELDWLSNPSFCVGRAASPGPPAEEATATASNQLLPTRSPVKSESSDDSDADRKRRQTSRKKKKEKKRKKQRQHHKRARSKRSASSSSSDSEPPSDSGKPRQGAAADAGRRLVWLEDAQALTGDTFRTDKRPDPANWEYKSLYRGDIARYKRKGDSCLGLNPKKQRVSWEGAPRQKKPPHAQGERYFARRNVGLMSEAGLAVRPHGPEPPAAGPAAFIPVADPEEAAPPVTSWLNPLGIYDPATAQWLQGQGPAPEQGPAPPDPPADAEAAALRARVEDFNRRLRETPRDVQLWMAFVDFQDEAMRRPGLYALEADGEPRQRASLRLVLEKKLAVLERALDSNQGSVELQLARLRVCAELWEPGALAKEWQKLLFLHPNDAALWQKYLLFCQSQFSTFTVSRLLAAYGKCLSTLSAVQDGSILSHPARPGTEDALFALFLQLCHFLRQAGHTEKAVSLFQAMVDFTFFKPDSVKELPTRGQVEFFEPFWDSGEPRAGEKGARGWRAWMHQQERGGWVIVTPDEEEDEADDEGPEVRDKTLPRWQLWLAAERSREQRHWRPWRPEKNKKQSEEDCEDPERQVLFDDIGQSLIRLTRPELRFRLVTAFLQFLGVPCGARPPAACLALALDEADLFDGGLSDEQPLTAPQPPFSGVGCVGRTDPLGSRRGARGHGREGEDFIRNLLHLLLPLFAGPERAQLCLAWLRYEVAKVLWCLHTKNKKRLKSRGKNCKKLAKSLLKEPENRNNFCLWQLYAHLEWLLGNTDDARKVFEAALGAAGGRALQDGGVCGLGLLYAQLELELGLAPESRGPAAARAAHILTRLTESEPGAPGPGPASAVPVLKARKAYERALEACLQEEGAAPGRLASVAGCFMLFQYLTVGIEAAVRVHDQVKAQLGTPGPPAGAGLEDAASPGRPGPALEALALMHTNLLRFHMRVGVYPLAPLREALAGALRLYPDNQGLWRAFVQVQNKTHSASRTRRFFDAVTRSSKALEPWLFAIEAEQMRKRLVESVQRVDGREVHATLPESGLAHRIRGLFESAVRTESGGQCPLLWRMYLRFLVSLGNKERSKGVFYRALQNCPWAKVLYLDAVEYFPDEMQETLDLMTEKELRVRLPPEELELLLED